MVQPEVESPRRKICKDSPGVGGRGPDVSGPDERQSVVLRARPRSEHSLLSAPSRRSLCKHAPRMKAGPTDARVGHGSDRLNLGLIVAVALSIEFWVALSTFFLRHV
jgi:hypothetical protein